MACEPGVYVLRRVVDGVMAFCHDRAPLEALGVLAGTRCRHRAGRYVCVEDWATGATEASEAHAQLTADGVAACHRQLDAKYGVEREAPLVVGLFHSHPFGAEPSLSARDVATFAAFPYSAPGNVFVLVNPHSGHFLVYQRGGSGQLAEREWVEYAPQETRSP
ncbi:MAG: Mov34/MPN/PAD-1 family protein [Candidatus Brocadiia bacterium]